MDLLSLFIQETYDQLEKREWNDCKDLADQMIEALREVDKKFQTSQPSLYVSSLIKTFVSSLSSLDVVKEDFVTNSTKFYEFCNTLLKPTGLKEVLKSNYDPTLYLTETEIANRLVKELSKVLTFKTNQPQETTSEDDVSKLLSSLMTQFDPSKLPKSKSRRASKKGKRR